MRCSVFIGSSRKIHGHALFAFTKTSRCHCLLLCCYVVFQPCRMYISSNIFIILHQMETLCWDGNGLLHCWVFQHLNWATAWRKRVWPTLCVFDLQTFIFIFVFKVDCAAVLRFSSSLTAQVVFWQQCSFFKERERRVYLWVYMLAPQGPDLLIIIFFFQSCLFGHDTMPFFFKQGSWE